MSHTPANLLTQRTIPTNRATRAEFCQFCQRFPGEPKMKTEPGTPNPLPPKKAVTLNQQPITKATQMAKGCRRKRG